MPATTLTGIRREAFFFASKVIDFEGAGTELHAIFHVGNFSTLQ